MVGVKKESFEKLGEKRPRTRCINDGYTFDDRWEKRLLQMARSFTKDGLEIASLTGSREN